MFDVAVLGGGPAGMAAAAHAAGNGARTILLDEQNAPGGQVYRRPAIGLTAAPSGDSREGDRLRARLADSSAVVRTSRRVWGLGGGPLVRAGDPPVPFRLDICADDAVETIEAMALILCPGTYERVIPFPGWTLPGVIGLAGATILLKAQAILPGQRTVVCGTGPLLAAVAAGILAKGGQVSAVVDASPRSAWIGKLPSLSRRPALFARGASWMARILAAGVPILSAHRVVRAYGTDSVTGVDVTPRAGGAVSRIECDCVCVGHGLVPATEASRLYGARCVYDASRGGWVPELDAAQRTTVAHLYAAGDSAGIAGAAVAPLSGEAAARSALMDLDLLPKSAASRARQEHGAAQRRVVQFGAAMATMMVPPADLVDAIPPACVVCRCEDVTRAEIDAAIDAGALDLNQLKQFTRCGMGPCQGRVCGESAAEILARRVGGREAAGWWTPRIPLRPVPMAALLDRFEYSDIPVPAPAPI